MKKYNIGLDIGTESVGWSVVEENTLKIIKKGSTPLWGVRLFNKADSAAERRAKRSTRRRYDRRRERIKLLQEEFKEEINKVDTNFYKKLQESKYNSKDIINKTIFCSVEEKGLIKKYQSEYKTIYHLRNKLINDPTKEDIRLVYLAIHHIIKYRGNFNYNMPKFNINEINIKIILQDFFDSLNDVVLEYELPSNLKELIDFNRLEKALLNPLKTDAIIEVKETLKEYINDTNFIKEFTNLMLGRNANINKLLFLNLDSKIELSFSTSKWEDSQEDLMTSLGDKYETLELLKYAYDALFLKKMFNDSDAKYISSYMVKRYEKHHIDLENLKAILRYDRKLYNKVFKNSKELCLYEKYLTNKIDYKEFENTIEKYINQICEINSSVKDLFENNMKDSLENDSFMPKISSTDNGKFPYQLNEVELLKIIENQGKYYPFLLERVDDNPDSDYKIVRLLKFKIPYYVGPLVSKEKSKNAWMIRNEGYENVHINPYNFDNIINKEASAEEFIRRMIAKDTYLINEYALPNNSILYSKFKVINELKQIGVNNYKIENKDLNRIVEELFMKESGSITERKFINYLNQSNLFNMFNGDLDIKGYSSDKKFANNMQSYIDFFGDKGIFEKTNYTIDDAENIIEWITIFEDKDILEKKVRKNYPLLNDNQIKKLLNKKYSGWGRLSKKLLTGIIYNDKKTHLPKTIMNLLEETDENFMQIINNDEYKFQEKIKKENKYTANIDKINYDVVKDLATSPATKRGIYQALKLVDEIVNIMGYEPANIMIEMARSDEEKKRTDTRKKYLQNIYNVCKNQIKDYKRLKNELDTHEINSTKLFLYFIQEGKCLYSGKPINIDDLDNKALYEIDHIIPRTLIKDDSIENKALVLREYNQAKSSSYVLPEQYRNSEQIKWWNKLKEMKLMSSKKFYNLTRKIYKEEDIQGFINRQLVETRQITKHVANILNTYYKNTKIIYLKANLSHNYREKYNLFKFRDINDYHHAHDSYLAAVLGEYKDKYLNFDIDFETIKEMNNKIIELNDGKKECLKYGYVINSLDENVFDISCKLSIKFINKNNGEIKFDPKYFNKMVENTLYRNDILVSRKTDIRSGRFYKETLYKKKIATIPINKRMTDTNMYGGYSNMETKNMILVKYDNKYKIIGIPKYFNKNTSNDEIHQFINNQINNKNNIDYKIIKTDIPFETELLYKGQNVYIKGYSTQNNGCELSNARQLKIHKELLKKWKYALAYILNNNKKYEQDVIIYADDIYNYLVNVEGYSLFKNATDKIKNTIVFSSLSLPEKQKIIKELFKLYQCKSVNANLSDFKLSSSLGRLNACNITNGEIISKSITGKKESGYEF